MSLVTGTSGFYFGGMLKTLLMRLNVSLAQSARPQTAQQIQERTGTVTSDVASVEADDFSHLC